MQTYCVFVFCIVMYIYIVYSTTIKFIIHSTYYYNYCVIESENSQSIMTYPNTIFIIIIIIHKALCFVQGTFYIHVHAIYYIYTV